MLYLYWIDDNGESKSLQLPVNNEVYIGRLLRSDYEKFKDQLGGLDYRDLVYKLFIFTNESLLSPMELTDNYVSRRHAKIIAVNGELIIYDHGSRGFGSLNGTYINGMEVPKGSSIKIPVEDEIELMLGPKTKFKIIRSEVETPTVKIDLNLPVEVPKTLQNEIKRRGLKYTPVKDNIWIIHEPFEKIPDLQVQYKSTKPTIKEAIQKIVKFTYEAIIKLEHYMKMREDFILRSEIESKIEQVLWALKEYKINVVEDFMEELELWYNQFQNAIEESIIKASIENLIKILIKIKDRLEFCT